MSVHKSEMCCVGISGIFHQVLDRVACIASRQCPIILMGESGTGKEMIAQLVVVQERPESNGQRDVPEKCSLHQPTHATSTAAATLAAFPVKTPLPACTFHAPACRDSANAALVSSIIRLSALSLVTSRVLSINRSIHSISIFNYNKSSYISGQHIPFF